MSSYYSFILLEEMRRERLKRALDDSILQIKKQLQMEHSNNVQMTAGSGIEVSVFVTDDSVSGYDKSVAINKMMLQEESDQSETKRDELDFSELLFSACKKPTKLELELDSWVKRVDERPIISEKDENDRTRVLAELAKTVRTSSMDIEDKIRSVKMRVSSYLQGAVAITELDREKMESIYYEYCALCKLLEVQPTERVHYRVEKEVKRMSSVLEKRRQDEYVMEVIEDIMEDLGCHAKDDAVLDHTLGQIYSIDGHPLCDIFVGNDAGGIMFEPVGESKEGSLERQRQIEDSANHVCSLYTTLEERAAEKGVILKRVYIEPAHIGTMCIQSDISERGIRKRQRKTAAQKQRALNLEG